MNKTLSPQELDCYPLFHLFKKNHQKQYNIKLQKSIGFTISFYTFCLNNKESVFQNINKSATTAPHPEQI